MHDNTLNLFLKYCFGLLVAVFGLILTTDATHIRAGEITARRIDNVTLTFEFTFTGFRDTESGIEFGGGVFDFGDGTTIERDFRIVRTPVGNQLEMVQFVVTHTYQAPNSYVVSYEEEFRNGGIINMDNSVNTTFYVESMIVIDPFFGLNNTPILTVPPIDFAAVGALFIHNAGAFDSDGDSLSYKFTIPKQGRGTEVSNYRELNDPEFYSNFAQGNEAQNDPPKLSIDPVTGDLIWDAPGDAELDDQREYNVAFVIEEWRQIAGQWFRLGFVTRDMQIIVEETDNERPTLEVPDDLCVEAGMNVNELIQGNDPDNHPVKLEAFGGPFEVLNPATFSPDPATFQEPPGFLTFDWNTVCGNVRARPYEVQFKVTDDPDQGPRLVNFETMKITVIGPAPTGLNTTVQPGRSIQLNWDNYSCNNADRMEIYRKVGSLDFEIGECQSGVPPNAGYQKIAEVPIGVTEFLDNNNGDGLAAGAKYCYRLVAKYPAPGSGESYPSSEACDSLIIDVPVITNVDVKSTDKENGEILVRWNPPIQIDQTTFPPTYTYDLLRGEGRSRQENTSYTLLASNTADTVFMDSGLNTDDLSYHYYVRLYDGGGVLVDSSATASNVRLELQPLLNAISLSWSGDIPWTLTAQNYPYHYIFRDQVSTDDPAELVLIDSVNVSSGGLSYLDNGSFNDIALDEEIEYCYFVSTQGTYDNDLLPEPLINATQISCAQPNDTIPPCRPPQVIIEEADICSARVAALPCGTFIYSQNLNWTVNQNPECDDDIISYNIYFSETGDEEDYVLKASTRETSFLDDELNSLKGCYRISAVDRSGNESGLSEPVCSDNCPVYILPNAFTPNNDGINDTFGPLNNNGLNISNFDNGKCPRFVKSVNLSVFDRTGVEVYNYSSFENQNGIFINWDGKNKVGQDLPAGLYFYEAKVVYDVLNPGEANKTLKGWVQLLK